MSRMEEGTDRQTPVSVAQHRLEDKKKTLTQELSAMDLHMKKLDALADDLKLAEQATRNKVEELFSHLQQLMDAQRDECQRNVSKTFAEMSGLLQDDLERITETVKKSKEVMLASDVVLERNPSFVANYVARSQQLEECIIELLLHRHSEPVSVKKVSSLISDSASSGFDGSCFDEELVGLNLPVRVVDAFLAQNTESHSLDGITASSGQTTSGVDTSTDLETANASVSIEDQSNASDEPPTCESSLKSETHSGEGHSGEGYSGEAHSGEAHSGEAHSGETHSGEAHSGAGGEAHSDAGGDTHSGADGEAHSGETHSGEAHSGADGEAHSDAGGDTHSGADGEAHSGEAHSGEAHSGADGEAHSDAGGDTHSGADGEAHSGETPNGEAHSGADGEAHSGADGEAHSGADGEAHSGEAHSGEAHSGADGETHNGDTQSGADEPSKAESIKVSHVSCPQLPSPDALQSNEQSEATNKEYSVILDSVDVKRKESLSSDQESGSCVSLNFTESGKPVLTYLPPSQGKSWNVLVTDVLTPQCKLCVQVFGPQVVKLMEDMSSCYLSEESEDADWRLKVPPEVGDFCCAQFSEDDCWYRARVDAVEQLLSSDGNSPIEPWITVSYVDYGNSEQLPLSRLRLLEPRFCTLPCQAFVCKLSNVRSFAPCSSADSWPSTVYNWLSKLLIGQSVEVVVLKSLEQNRVEIDVSLSPEVLFSSESLANFPLPVQSIANLSSFRNSTVPISLICFMLSTGIASIDQQTTHELQTSVSVPPSDSHSTSDITSSGSVAESTSVDLSNACDVQEGFSSPLVTVDDENMFPLMISHLVSPSEFYVNPLQPEMSNLQQSMNKYYSLASNREVLRNDNLKTGSICCVESDNSWFRGVITESHRKCLVYYVDFGDSEWKMPSSLYALSPKFLTFPVQCLRCTLLLPPQCPLPLNTDGRDSGNSWPSRANVPFKKLTDDKKLFAKVDSCQAIQKFLKLKKWSDTIVVQQLYDTAGGCDVNLGEKILKDIADTQPALMQRWNPMESDYLSHRNSYELDDEDVGSVLHGYKSKGNRLCRFFNTHSGCKRGNLCPYQHLKKDVPDFQPEETYCKTESIALPSVGDWVNVTVTFVLSVKKLYIQLPFGLRSPFSTPDSDSKTGFDAEFFAKKMDKFYNHKVFSGFETTQPALGEIVVARSMDQHWYRGRVVDMHRGEIKVFFVDYGNCEWVRSNYIRQMQDEFFHVPFQAIECALSDVEVCDQSNSSVRETLWDLVAKKLLIAQVTWKGWNRVLGIELHDIATDTNINRLLVEKGLAVSAMAPLKQLLGSPVCDLAAFPG